MSTNSGPSDRAGRYSVWHDDRPRFTTSRAALRRFPLGFTRVATVEAKALDDVWELTNHVDRDWTTNAAVTLVAPGPHRSTSVGDVVVDPDGTAWMVAGVGFTRMWAS
jgi:hypothetical protein